MLSKAHLIVVLGLFAVAVAIWGASVSYAGPKPSGQDDSGLSAPALGL